MATLKFDLTLDDTNKILGLLGAQPYVEVAGLIQSIQSQAQPQLPSLEAAMKAEAEAAAKPAE